MNGEHDQQTSEQQFQKDSRVEYERQHDERRTAAYRWGKIEEFMVAQVRINASLERLLYIIVGTLVTAGIGALVWVLTKGG